MQSTGEGDTTNSRGDGTCDPRAAVRDLTAHDAHEVVRVACDAADLALHRVDMRGIHERKRSCSRLVAAEVIVRGAPREVLFVIHGARSEVPDGALQVTRDGVVLHIWRFPFDPYLPGLPSMVSRTRVRELLDALGVPDGDVTLRTRAYRPSRRAVIEVQIAGQQAQGRVVYLKTLSGGRSAEVAAVHRQLIDVVPVPRIVGVDDRLGILVMEALGGATLRAALEHPSELPAADKIVGISRALAASELRTSADPLRFADAQRHVGLLSREFPDKATAIAHAAEDAAQISGDVVPVHGDLHDGQILVGASRVVGLLDVDGAGDGLIAHDAANLLVRLDVVANEPASMLVRDLTAQYRELVGAEALRRAQIGAWLALATGPYRAQTNDWREVASARLARSLHLAGIATR